MFVSNVRENKLPDKYLKYVHYKCMLLVAPDILHPRVFCLSVFKTVQN